MKKCLSVGILAAVVGAATGIASAQVAKEPVGDVAPVVKAAGGIETADTLRQLPTDDPIYDSIHYQGAPGGNTPRRR